MFEMKTCRTVRWALTVACRGAGVALSGGLLSPPGPHAMGPILMISFQRSVGLRWVNRPRVTQHVAGAGGWASARRPRL